MRGSTLLLVASLALAVAAVGGCGDGDESSPADESPPAARDAQPTTEERSRAKSAFIARGNRVCSRLVSRITWIRSTYFSRYFTGQGLSRAQLSRGLTRAASAVRSALEDLRKLRPPRGDERQLQALYREADQAAGELERARRNRRLSRAILRGRNPFARASRLASQYGLSVCAQA